MSRIQDRVKQRREYLRKKGTAYTKMSLAALLIVPCLLIGMSILMAGLFAATFRQPPLSHPLVIIGLFLLVLAPSLLGYFATRSHRAAKQIPYVPPVTSGTLPAEEVLLRGSDASAQEQSQVLLRGTHNTEETDGQELLRSSQGND